MNYHTLYDALIAEADADAQVERVQLGLSWSCLALANDSPDSADTVTEFAQPAMGICFSPQQVGRTIPWAGTLTGRTVHELREWIFHWEGAAATVGAMAINAAINGRTNLVTGAQVIALPCPKHLQVFHYFRPQLAGRNVVVIGHYPGLEGFAETASWQCIERNPRPGDLPDTAAEFVLPRADWVFITGSSIANKTLPRLLALASQATVVLMGPSVPWASCWADFGVDYLAGVAIRSRSALWQVAAEAGGTRLFDEACEYRIRQLKP